MAKKEKTVEVGWFSIVSIILLVAIFVATLWSGQQAERIEAMQVGGKENWNKMKQIMKSDDYKAQYTQNIDLIIQELENPNDRDMIMGEDEVLIDEDGNEINIEQLLMEATENDANTINEEE